MKIAVLENIRSAYNVGSIFRSADGAGISKLFLVGYTPSPIDRFGRVQPEIQKTSLGASETIAWNHQPSLSSQEIENFKAEGYMVVAVEQGKESVSLPEFTPPENVVYILGNEVDGISEELLNLADIIVEIPMYGEKESLNVSVAAGIIFYHGIS